MRRQEDRKHRLPDFLNFLATVGKTLFNENDVLSIDKTDEIWKQIRENEIFHIASFSIAFPFKEKDKLKTVFSALRNDLMGIKQYFTTYRFYENCLLHIDTSFCIDNFEQLIEFDGDSFYIYDSELKNGLVMEASEEHWEKKAEYVWTFELEVWGEDWIQKVVKAYLETQRRDLL